LKQGYRRLSPGKMFPKVEMVYFLDLIRKLRSKFSIKSSATMFSQPLSFIGALNEFLLITSSDQKKSTLPL